MKFKKDENGQLILDNDGNPIAIDDNGKEINLEDNQTLDSKSIVNEITKKFNIKPKTNTDKENITKDDIISIVGDVLAKGRQEEKDKMYNRNDQLKNQLSEQEELKQEVFSGVQEMLKPIASALSNVQSSVTQSVQASTEAELRSLKGELLAKANGKVIEEMVQGNSPEELLSNFEKAVEAYARYNPVKEGDTSEENNSDTQTKEEGKSTTPEQDNLDLMSQLDISVPEQYASVPFDQLPDVERQKIEDQIAQQVENNPELKAKLEAQQTQQPDNQNAQTPTVADNTNDQNQNKTVKYNNLPNVVNVARKVLTGTEGFNDPSQVPFEADGSAFQKKWGDNREAMLDQALQVVEQVRN